MPRPPLAEVRPQRVEHHGHVSEDAYAWLRDREDPAVIAYLEDENAYTEAMTAHTADLRETLYEEIRGRVQETDVSAPTRKGDWWYVVRTHEGSQYAQHCRREGAPDGPETVFLDENVLAEGHDYFRLGNLSVSPDQRLAAYITDTNGSEIFTLRVRDLDTGDDLEDTIEGVSYGLAWASDNRHVFYTVLNPMMRPHQVWRHEIGGAGDDVLVYEDADERFFVGVGRSRSGAFIAFSSESAVTTEMHVLDADDATGQPRVIHPREQDLEYSIAHTGDRFFITTNADATNFRLVEAPIDTPGREHWREVIAHREDVKIEGVDAFADHLLIYERADAVTRIRVLELATGEQHTIDQPEPVCAAGPGSNLEFEATVVRYGYTSLVTPTSAYDYDLTTRERTLVKQQAVLGGYDRDDYVTTREWATAPDGERVPISLVHRRDLDLDGDNPTLLYGYGSYEISIPPGFSSARLSLLDRGVVFAIGHVRGGGELGRRWYEQGKYRNKRNTFTDFIACAERLIEAGYTAPERLAIRGGSAGGLLMGAVANLRPDLFGAIVAQVPFVDVINTMFDDTLPLTVIEYEEWGDPNDPEYFDYMRSYAPYENLAAVDYPSMLVTGGLNDPRVGFWEPAKWVARLRATATGAKPLLLKTELGAGHGGPSGRYDAWREEARVFAFVLDQLGAAATTTAG